MSGALDGYSGLIIFIALFWLSNTNKPLTFWVGMGILALMASGQL